MTEKSNAQSTFDVLRGGALVSSEQKQIQQQMQKVQQNMQQLQQELKNNPGDSSAQQQQLQNVQKEIAQLKNGIHQEQTDNNAISASSYGNQAEQQSHVHVLQQQQQQLVGLERQATDLQHQLQARQQQFSQTEGVTKAILG